MPRLDPLALELLSFLCQAHAEGLRVTRVKGNWKDALLRLRYMGLVSWDSFVPSPSAMADWRERKRKSEATAQINAEPSEPPRPKAAEEGGAAARAALTHGAEHAAPPETPRPRKPPASMAEKAARFEAQPKRPARAKRSRNSRGASGKAREAPSAEESTSAERDKVRAPISPEPAANNPPPPAPSLGLPMLARDPTQAPPGYQSRPGQIDLSDAVIKTAQAKGSPKRQRVIEEARKRNEEGRSSGEQGISVHVRLTQRTLLEMDEREAREKCPIERAKTALRKRHAPVCDAEVVDGPKGHFLVGRRFLTKEEMLAEAERIAS